MRLLAFFVGIFLSFSTISLYAADSSNGCGPGWYVAKDNSFLSSSLRATTHYFLFPIVTFGMTSGTSNCAKHTLVERDKASLQFANSSFDLLRQDIARGEGQHLTAYFQTFGCENSAHSPLAHELQKSFHDGLYQSDEPVDYVLTTRQLIDGSMEFKSVCS